MIIVLFLCKYGTLMLVYKIGGMYMEKNEKKVSKEKKMKKEVVSTSIL